MTRRRFPEAGLFVLEAAMLERRKTGGVVWYESPLLRDIGVRHAFSTRIGGVSAGVFSSLNLGNPSGCPEQDSRENILENERQVMRAAGFEPGTVELCRVHQVHGCAVAARMRGAAHNPHEQADAIVTDDTARVLSVRVADCVPVLLAARDGGVVAAVHAGWRGVASGVVRRAMEMMGRRDLIAAIGPSIGVDAFEVGPEVIDELEGAFERPRDATRFVRSGRPGKWHVDLRAAIDEQLLEGAVGGVSIDSTDRCTFRDSGEFFSHRREKGVTGRMAAFIGARKPS